MVIIAIISGVYRVLEILRFFFAKYWCIEWKKIEFVKCGGFPVFFIDFFRCT